MFDRQALAEGLDTLAGAARGAVFDVTGNAQGIFERIESELPGTYMLGVESGPTDKDGRPIPFASKSPGVEPSCARAGF